MTLRETVARVLSSAGKPWGVAAYTDRPKPMFHFVRVSFGWGLQVGPAWANYFRSDCHGKSLNARLWTYGPGLSLRSTPPLFSERTGRVPSLPLPRGWRLLFLPRIPRP